MHRRPSSALDAALATLLRAADKLAKHLFPSAPAGRPAGGPVVFRHYL